MYNYRIKIGKSWSSLFEYFSFEDLKIGKDIGKS